MQGQEEEEVSTSSDEDSLRIAGVKIWGILGGKGANDGIFCGVEP